MDTPGSTTTPSKHKKVRKYEYDTITVREGNRPTPSSKYDFVKVKVWLEDHYYVLSRFLVSRVLNVTKVPPHPFLSFPLNVIGICCTSYNALHPIPPLYSIESFMFVSSIPSLRVMRCVLCCVLRCVACVLASSCVMCYTLRPSRILASHFSSCVSLPASPACCLASACLFLRPATHLPSATHLSSLSSSSYSSSLRWTKSMQSRSPLSSRSDSWTRA